MGSRFPSCGLCRRLRASYAVPRLRTGICEGCAQRISSFVLTGSARELKQMWRLEVEESGEPRARAVAQKGLASGASGTADRKIHCDLATAYLDSGLAQDALHEAALALSPPSPHMGALEVVFSRQLAPRGVLERLRAKLYPD